MCGISDKTIANTNCKEKFPLAELATETTPKSKLAAGNCYYSVPFVAKDCTYAMCSDSTAIAKGNKNC